MLAIYAVSNQPYHFDLQKTPKDFVCRRIDPKVDSAIGYVSELLRKESFPYHIFLTHQWKWEDMPQGYAEVKKGNVIKGLVWIENNTGEGLSCII